MHIDHSSKKSHSGIGSAALDMTPYPAGPPCYAEYFLYIYIYIIFAFFAFGIEIGKCVNSSLFRVVLCMHSVQHVNGSVFFGYAKHCKSQPLGLQNATNIVNSSVLLKY